MEPTNLLVLNIEVSKVAALLEGDGAVISFYGPEHPHRSAVIFSVPRGIADSVADRLAAEGGEVIWLLENEESPLTKFDVRTRTFFASLEYEGDQEYEESVAEERRGGYRPLPKITPEMLVQMADGSFQIKLNQRT